MEIEQTRHYEYGEEEGTPLAKSGHFRSTHHTAGGGDFNKTHPLLIIAGSIIAEIKDYPTLICLSLTCRAFYTLIHNSSFILPTAFDNLEREIRVKPRSRPLDFSSETGLLEDDSTNLAAYDNAVLSWESDMALPRPDGITLFCDYDLLRYSTCQLHTLDWLPCYSCRRILRIATNFFPDEIKYSRTIFGSNALARKCIDCSIGESLRFSQPLRYVQDMPRGISGFRLRCANCRHVEWVQKRPLGQQAKRKLCAECFRDLLAQKNEKPGDALWEVWGVLREMPIEPAKTRSRKKDLVIIADDEAHFVDEPNLEAVVERRQSWCRFEVLDVCDS